MEPKLTQMITAVTRRVLISGDIDKIFDEISNPTIVYEFTVRLSVDQINQILKRMIDGGLLASEGEALKTTGDGTTAQLMIEFVRTVGEILG